MVRLAGKVQKLADQKKWIDRIFEENPSMNEVYPGESRYILEPFCIECGQIEFFDLGKNPIFRETFTIGPAVEEEKGFEITNDCIGCGKCKSDCPQQCISEGTPFVIRQEHCLHCGRSERCGRCIHLRKSFCIIRRQSLQQGWWSRSGGHVIFRRNVLKNAGSAAPVRDKKRRSTD